MASIDRFIQGGYILYPRGTFGTNYYIFNKVIGNVPDVNFKDNYNKTTLKTFGKYPAIFYVGNTLYRTFSLSTVFTSDQNMYNYHNVHVNDSLAGEIPDWNPDITYQTGDIIKIFNAGTNNFLYFKCVAPHNNKNPITFGGSSIYWSSISAPSNTNSNIDQTEDSILTTAYDAYMSFKRQVDQRIPWVVRGSVSGEDFIVDIEITSTAHNQNSIIKMGGNVQAGRETCGKDDGMNGKFNSYTTGDIFFSDYIQVTIECTEIDDYIYPDPENNISGDGSEDRFNIFGES